MTPTASKALIALVLMCSSHVAVTESTLTSPCIEGACRSCSEEQFVDICGSGKWQQIQRGSYACVDGKLIVSSQSSSFLQIAEHTGDPSSSAPLQATAPPPSDTPASSVPSSQIPPQKVASGSPSLVPISPSSSSATTSDVTSVIGTLFTGDFTYYIDGLGACGITNSPDQSIVAIGHAMFDRYTPNGNPNRNPLCGRTVSLHGKDGLFYDATIVDRCSGCAETDLDMTETLFNKVTNHGDGRAHGMTWKIQ